MGLLLISVRASAVEVVISDGVGDGSASFGIDEFGSIWGCGGHGVVFDPTGPTTAAQGSCHSTLYLFESAGDWRQAMSSDHWSYHPVYNSSNGLSCDVNSGRSSDVLATGMHVISDVVSPNHRVTEFVVPSYQELKVRLEQTACGSNLYQVYEFSVDTGSVDFIASRYSDGDLSFPSPWSWTQNKGSGQPSLPVVEMTDVSGDISMSVEMQGDAVFEGWRLWQCPWGGASEFARFMNQDGWTAAQLDQEYQCTGGPWCDRTEATTGATMTVGPKDTGIGLQGQLFVDSSAPKEISFLTSLSPGQQSTVDIVSATATPDALWPVDGSLVPVQLDVVAEGCGVSCSIASVTSNQPIDLPGSPNADYDIVSELSLSLRAERDGAAERLYWVDVSCEDVMGNTSLVMVPVTVPGAGPPPGGGPPGGGPPGGGPPGGGPPGGGPPGNGP